MSRMSGNEKCVFCGWTRRSAYQSVRFFCIPKEPGLKRVRWLQVFGDREISPKDRVCSVHFRQGRPSSDPSHEDFVPHLYLNNEPPPEVLDYLESLADTNTKLEKVSSQLAANKPSFLAVDGLQSAQNPLLRMGNRAVKPSILKRKRRPKDELFDEEEDLEVNVTTDAPPVADRVDDFEETHKVHAEPSLEEPPSQPPTLQPTTQRRGQPVKSGVKFTVIQRNIVDAVGMKPGQTVIIRRRVKKAPKHLE